MAELINKDKRLFFEINNTLGKWKSNQAKKKGATMNNVQI